MPHRLSYHVGRSWSGPGHLEESCPCPKEPCGLVSGIRAAPECTEHPWWRAKSMRVGHKPESCMGPGHFRGYFCEGCGEIASSDDCCRRSHGV